MLACGSVEGRAFHWASVTAMSSEPDPTSIGRDLLALTRRGLVEPTPSLISGTEAFRFRHALIRDAAYRRLPKGRRAELHERHARWLELMAGERLAEFDDFVAYHIDRAVQLRAELGPLDASGKALAAEAAATDLGGDPGDGARTSEWPACCSGGPSSDTTPATRVARMRRAARGGAHGGG